VQIADSLTGRRGTDIYPNSLSGITGWIIRMVLGAFSLTFLFDVFLPVVVNEIEKLLPVMYAAFLIDMP
jgi:hypothetical protein